MKFLFNTSGVKFSVYHETEKIFTSSRWEKAVESIKDELKNFEKKRKALFKKKSDLAKVILLLLCVKNANLVPTAFGEISYEIETDGELGFIFECEDEDFAEKMIFGAREEAKGLLEDKNIKIFEKNVNQIEEGLYVPLSPKKEIFVLHNIDIESINFAIENVLYGFSVGEQNKTIEIVKIDSSIDQFIEKEGKGKSEIAGYYMKLNASNMIDVAVKNNLEEIKRDYISLDEEENSESENNENEKEETKIEMASFSFRDFPSLESIKDSIENNSGNDEENYGSKIEEKYLKILKKARKILLEKGHHKEKKIKKETKEKLVSILRRKISEVAEIKLSDDIELENIFKEISKNSAVEEFFLDKNIREEILKEIIS